VVKEGLSREIRRGGVKSSPIYIWKWWWSKSSASIYCSRKSKPLSRESGNSRRGNGYAYDRATTQSGLSKNLNCNISGTSSSREPNMRSMNYDDVVNYCSAPITEMLF